MSTRYDELPSPSSTNDVITADSGADGVGVAGVVGDMLADEVVGDVVVGVVCVGMLSAEAEQILVVSAGQRGAAGTGQGAHVRSSFIVTDAHGRARLDRCQVFI